MSGWHKGCLCGCLYEEECRDYEPPIQRVAHVHVVHIVDHRTLPREYVESEVTIVRDETPPDLPELRP